MINNKNISTEDEALIPGLKLAKELIEIEIAENIEYVKDEYSEGYVDALMTALDRIEFELEFSFTCLGCSQNTSELGEYYMVHNHVWHPATKETEGRGMLCISCLENRLGRQLNKADFTDAPINDIYKEVSDKLKDRLSK